MLVKAAGEVLDFAVELCSETFCEAALFSNPVEEARPMHELFCLAVQAHDHDLGIEEAIRAMLAV